MNKQTIKYYDANARQYCIETAFIDLKELYIPFLEQLQPEAYILDAGCGSGRDTKFFLSRGYQVTAFDASRELIAESSQFTGMKTECRTFSEVDWQAEFDGVWACASLLHLTRKEFEETFVSLMRALKTKGVFYFSVKRGEGSGYDREGRFFTYYTKRAIIGFIKELSIVDVFEVWETQGNDQVWINCLIKKL